MGWPTLLVLLILAGLIIYWLFFHTEGVLLGQRVVTWLYDVYATRYDGIKGFDAETESTYLGGPLSDALRRFAGALVLDIGTGTGRLPLALCDEPGFQGRVIGFDDSLKMLEQARKKTAPFGDRIRLIWQDSTTLPFNEGIFDCVTAMEMLEFTPDPHAQLVEALRVLKPGGLLAATRRRAMPAILMPGRIYSETAFEAMLLALGLEEVERHIWQVDYDLYTAWKPGQSDPSAYRHLVEILRCPACGDVNWGEAETDIRCEACGAEISLFDHILLLKTAAPRKKF